MSSTGAGQKDLATSGLLGTPLGSEPKTGQLAVDQQRNQMLAALEATLALIAAGGTAVNNSTFVFRTVTTSAAVTGADTSIAVDASGGALAPTLPLAASVPGKIFNFIKIDATGNAVTITRTGADTINGANTKVLAAQYNFTRVQSFGGTVWYVL